MMQPNPVTPSDDATIKRRLLRAMPTSRFEMQTLTRLADIRTSRALPTAAVECKRRPRLLINPDFVAKYCKRDEHLFLLVMHELWHVLLAHTRMYPKMTQAQNIAFDAIINAGLMRDFPDSVYQGFFDEINPADEFPSCLLRPPKGWPDTPEYPDIGPPGTQNILMRLYPSRRYWNMKPPLYEEVLNLLMKAGMMKMPFLLGNHEGDGETINDPYMKKIMEEVTEKWPEMQLRSRGKGSFMGKRRYNITPSSEDARRTFSRTLQQCLGPRPGRERRKAKVKTPGIGGNGVLPNARDRMAPARRMLGAPNTLYAQPSNVKARIPERPSRSHVYLDVSGSMNFVISHLLHLLIPYVGKGQAEAYQFSTQIKALPYAELQGGHLSTTGGTDINCVLEHALKEEPPVQRIIVLTDGATGNPLPHLAQGVVDRAMKLYIVLPNGCKLNVGVEEIATSVVELPPIQPI